jgi:hypothetical protein
MAQGRVGIRSVKINYADNAKFIGGIVVWGMDKEVFLILEMESAK